MQVGAQDALHNVVFLHPVDQILQQQGNSHQIISWDSTGDALAAARQLTWLLPACAGSVPASTIENHRYCSVPCLQPCSGHLIPHKVAHALACHDWNLSRWCCTPGHH
jgi:hypothetical protein